MFFAIYAIWAAIALAVFSRVRPASAVWIVLLSGWLFLPPGNYPRAGLPDGFPYWIIGGALPSDVWLAKSWTAPALTALLVAVFDRQRLRALHFHGSDVALLAFCLYPALQGVLVGGASPAGWSSALFLLGAWGVPWLIGRAYLRSATDAMEFAEVLALLMLLLLPIAAVESSSWARLHKLLFAMHPFAFEGGERYVGMRPVALFEHGSQYAIWCAGAALAGFWRWQMARAGKGAGGRGSAPVWAGVAGALVLLTLASQSLGAIAVMLAGLAALTVRGSFALLRLTVPLAVAAALIGLALHLAGAFPAAARAELVTPGQAALNALRGIGRASFAERRTWDQLAMPLIRDRLPFGWGHWDWFMPLHHRPWDLPMLVLGQFGLIGFAACLAALGWSLSRHLTWAARGSPRSRLCSVLILAFATDCLFNSFVFWPAIVAAGAMAGRPGTRQRAQEPDD